jgi:hypothetical protein
MEPLVNEDRMKLSKPVILAFAIIALAALASAILAYLHWGRAQTLAPESGPTAFFVYKGKTKGPFVLPAKSNSPDEIIVHLEKIDPANQPYLSIRILEVLEDADNFIPERFFEAVFDGTPIMPYSEQMPESSDVKWELRWQLVPEWNIIKIKQKLPMTIAVDVRSEKRIPIANQGIFPNFNDKQAPTGNIDYYYRGAFQSTFSIPMERCSRTNDYMIIHLINSSFMKEPLLGIRVTYIFEGANDPTKAPVIHATHSGQVIDSTIEKLDPATGGVWLVTWPIDPTWRTIKVIPELEMRFQIVVQDTNFDWSVFGKRPPQGESGKQSDEPCWP